MQGRWLLRRERIELEKVIIEILYKNGHEDKFEQVLSNEEMTKGFLEVLEVIEISMKEDIPGKITLGDNDKFGVFIRADEVVRFKTTFVESDSQ